MSPDDALQFEKWEGLGNDFLVVVLPEGAAPSAEEARLVCDRHFGVGGDGVLYVDETTPRMIVLNADGSRPEMCGNGLRCVAAFLADKRGEGRAELVIATDAGEKRCLVERRGDGLFDVTVDMGHATLGPALDVDVAGDVFTFSTVDVGNPHAITFEPHEDADVDRIGPAAERAPKAGTNVEFCRVVAGAARPRIEVTVWERGVGRTLACGTGACAVAAAACESGRAPFGEPIDVVLPGGPLEITVDAGRGLRMKGPARRVFRGVLSHRAGVTQP